MEKNICKNHESLRGDPPYFVIIPFNNIYVHTSLFSQRTRKSTFFIKKLITYLNTFLLI